MAATKKTVFCIVAGYSSAPDAFGCFATKAAAMRKAAAVKKQARRERFAIAVRKSQVYVKSGVFTNDPDQTVWTYDPRD